MREGKQKNVNQARFVDSINLAEGFLRRVKVTLNGIRIDRSKLFSCAHFSMKVEFEVSDISEQRRMAGFLIQMPDRVI